jgi:hypothetical protein
MRTSLQPKTQSHSLWIFPADNRRHAWPGVESNPDAHGPFGGVIKIDGLLCRSDGSKTELREPSRMVHLGHKLGQTSIQVGGGQ